VGDKIKYCGNCKQFVTATTGIRWGIFILLLLIFAPAALIYLIVKAGTGGRCPICNSKNWSVPEK